MRRLSLILCVLALSGCGAPSEKEFRAEANRICEEGGAETARLTRELEAREKAKRVNKDGRYLRTIRAVRPTVTDTMERLERLEAPESVRPQMKTITRGVLKGMDLGEQWLTSRGGLSGLQASRELEVLAVKTREAQQAIGLKDCVPDVIW